MATYTWIKLYIELLDDPKVGMMPDWCFRRFIQFLLYAREYNQDGLLGPVSDLAWRLRSSDDDMLTALRTMSEIGIVAETPDGWLVVNFAKRQAPMTPTERSREFQKRNRNEVKTKRFTDENETKTAAEIDSSSTSSSLSSSDSVSEEGGVGGETESVFTAYEHNIGMLTPMIGDALKDAEATYGPVWVCAAIQEAVQHEGRSWAYCDSILKRWKREGFKARKSSKQIPEDVSEHNRRVIEELAK